MRVVRLVIKRVIITFLAIALMASNTLALDGNLNLRYDAYPGMPESPLKTALKLFDQAEYHEVHEILSGQGDAEALMLKGMAHCGLMNYVRCASELEPFIEGYEDYIQGMPEYKLYRRALQHAARAFEGIGEKNKSLLTRQRRESILPPFVPPESEPAEVDPDEVQQVEPRDSGYDLRLGELAQHVPHKEIAQKISEGDHRGAQIMLKGHQDAHSLLLMGVAYYELKEYAPAARELSAFLDSGWAGDELRVFTLKRLMHAYYKSDQLQRSLETSRILITVLEGSQRTEVASMQEKIKRELTGNGSRVSESSDHFKTIFDGYVHGDVNRYVLSVLEDAYREVGQEFDVFPRTTLTVVLDTSNTFHDISRSPKWAGGVFMDGRIRIPVDGIDTIEKAEVKRVLYHEYVHALVYSIAEDCPRWLHEGLAEYFSRGPGAAKGKPSVPFAMLDSYFTSWNVLNVSKAYKESFLSVKALMDKYGMYKIKQYIEALGRGENREAAFEEVFSTSYDRFIEQAQ